MGNSIHQSIMIWPGGIIVGWCMFLLCREYITC